MKNGCLGVFVSFLFICSLTISAILFATSVTFLNPNFYKAELKKINFYDEAPEAIIDMVRASSDTAINPNQERALTSALSKTLTPAVIEAQTEQVLDNIFAYLKNKPLPGSFGMASLKTKFKSQFYKEINKVTPISRPAFEASIWPEVDKGVGAIFTDRNLTKDSGNRFGHKLSGLQKQYRLVSLLKYIFLGISIVLLILLILMRRTASSLLRWLGVSFSIAGILVFISAFGAGLAAGFIRNQVYGGFESLKQSGNAVIEAINRLTLDGLTEQKLFALGLFLVGLVLFVLSYVFRGSNKAVASNQAAPPQ